MSWLSWPIIVLGLVLLWVLYDVVQRKHAILHNFPIIGHFRYWLEAVGPELRQYIVTSNNEERPFSRDERRWVYASSKKQNNYFGFGTDNDLELSPNYLIIKQSAFPLSEPQPGDADYDEQYHIASAKVLGEYRGRAKSFRPASVVNVSAMSFGSLSSAAVEALNRGCQLTGCLHNTGEGGIAPYHDYGGGLIWQIGTGYFGCRDEQGHFSLSQFKDTVAAHHVKAIEIKISQGAKPGRGGVLPAKKISPEIAKIRGVPMGRDCVSPAAHSAFRDVDSMLDFVERLADETGLPIGIKSAVGQMDFWHELSRLMQDSERGVDYIAIDGGEGGTGAAPLVFSDHVALPFKIGFSRVFHVFFEAGLADHISFMGAGKLGFPQTAMFSFAMGIDMISVAREAMMAIGCIQAQRCHTDHCPTGVATQNRWLVRGLDATHKASRMANYIITLRKEILQLCRACGVDHPSKITRDHFEILHQDFRSSTIAECFATKAAR